MYFIRGNLPWQERYLGGGKGGTKEDKYKRILDKKDISGSLEGSWMLHPPRVSTCFNKIHP